MHVVQQSHSSEITLLLFSRHVIDIERKKPENMLLSTTGWVLIHTKPELRKHPRCGGQIGRMQASRAELLAELLAE